jgi:hypothetical protein
MRWVIVCWAVSMAGACDGGQGGEVSCESLEHVGSFPFDQIHRKTRVSAGHAFATAAEHRAWTIEWADHEPSSALTLTVERDTSRTSDADVYGPCEVSLHAPVWLTLETADGRLAVRLSATLVRSAGGAYVGGVAPVDDLEGATGDPLVLTPAHPTALVWFALPDGSEPYGGIDLVEDVLWASTAPVPSGAVEVARF